MITENSCVTGMSGRSYQLGKEIGNGGEGSVFPVKESCLVAKIYKKDIPGQEQKLLHMVYHHLPNLCDDTGKRILTLAWPNDVLYDAAGKFIGYVMPLIEGGIDIFEIDRGCTSPKAKQLFPDYSWKLNVEVARNLALAVDYLHGQNCVIGDMNCKNILVNSDGSISILDTDSFDLIDPQTGAHFKCGAGTEDYLAPELQGRNLRSETARFTTYTDDFALAIHIFQLLMDNYHPFSCRKLTQVKNSSNVNPRLQQIGEGKSPYINKYADADIPLGAPTLEETLPEYIRQDFAGTFDYTAASVWDCAPMRTTAEKWAEDLDMLLRECNAPGGLIRCQDHYYLGSRHECGRCKAQKRYEDFRKRKDTVSAAVPPQEAHTPPAAPVEQAPVAQPKAASAPTWPQPKVTWTIPHVLYWLLRIYSLVFMLILAVYSLTMIEADAFLPSFLSAAFLGWVPAIGAIRMEYFRSENIDRKWEPRFQPWASLYKIWMVIEHLAFISYILIPIVMPIAMVVDWTWDPDQFLLSLALLPVAVNRIFFLLNVKKK